MLLSEGETVKYKNVVGVVTFICDHSLSILVSKGKHRSQDVCVVVHKLDFKNVSKLTEK
jgi:hypothetical protein